MRCRKREEGRKNRHWFRRGKQKKGKYWTGKGNSVVEAVNLLTGLSEGKDFHILGLCSLPKLSYEFKITKQTPE